jgi:hypothetical protein
MADEAFVLVLAVLFAALLSWGFRSLPLEGWQIAASVPISKDDSGLWRGLNLTYYGILTANANVVGAAMMFILMGAVQVPPRATFILVAVLLVICIPSSRLIVRVVEKKPYGFTVGGASFVGILVAPWVALLLNRTLGALLDVHVPVVPALAALSISYAFGEGLGRLSCVSFGCCYGKPLSHLNPLLRRLLDKYSFVFFGKTKKIAYESGLDGEKVVPVQGITAVLFVGTGLVATELFLHSWHLTALCVSLVVTQGWRSVSETLRADYRGEGKISAYQLMAVMGLLYLLSVLLLLPATPVPRADVVTGIRSLWDPLMIVFLQALWIAIFLHTGCSEVTGSTLSFHVHRERI